jgi:hypothetical protein
LLECRLYRLAVARLDSVVDIAGPDIAEDLPKTAVGLTISTPRNPPFPWMTSRRGLRAEVRRMNFRVQRRAKPDDPAFARCRHRDRAVAAFFRSQQPWRCATRFGVDQRSNDCST